MKNILFISFLFIFICIACKKSEVVNPSSESIAITGCINKISIPVTAYNVDSADIKAINDLFTQNGIDHGNYRYCEYVHDSVQTYFPPYEKFDEKSVWVNKYSNGLRIFNAVLVFFFRYDVSNYIGGNTSTGNNLDTTPHLTLNQLRTSYLSDLKNNPTPEYSYPKPQYQDSCFNVEFGYYNLNAGIDNTHEKLVKAWKVTLKNREYPLGYYNDDDGKLIYYTDGIVY